MGPGVTPKGKTGTGPSCLDFKKSNRRRKRMTIPWVLAIFSLKNWPRICLSVSRFSSEISFIHTALSSSGRDSFGVGRAIRLQRTPFR